MSERRPVLEVEDLWVEVEGKEILKGVDLTVYAGEIHAIMGPNGSGKSTLAHAVMGHPRYQITRGRIRVNGQDVTDLTADERAKAGLFLAFQYPVAIPGVTVLNFLRTALKTLKGQEVPAVPFRRALREKMALLKMDEALVQRYLNDGFSGGEKKRAEILQLLMLEPPVAVLDETDSGLDVDALRQVAEGIKRYLTPERAVVLITHYQRILSHITPHFVHILVDGRIVRSGGPELAQEVEAKGYGWLTESASAERRG